MMLRMSFRHSFGSPVQDLLLLCKVFTSLACIAETLSCFLFVSSFTAWYDMLLLLGLGCPLSWHLSSNQFCFAVCMTILMFLLIYPYAGDLQESSCSSLGLLHLSRKICGSRVTRGSLFGRSFAKDLSCCFSEKLEWYFSVDTSFSAPMISS